MPTRSALLVLVVLSLAFAPAPFPRTRKAPPPRDFIGRWQQVGDPTVTLVVTHDSLTFVNQNRPSNAYHLTFDPRTTPRTFQLRHKDSAQRIYTGLYKVEGNELTLTSNSGTTAPTSFEVGAKQSFTRLER